MPHSGADSRIAAGTFSLWWQALLIVACVAATLLWTGWLVRLLLRAVSALLQAPGAWARGKRLALRLVDAPELKSLDQLPNPLSHGTAPSRMPPQKL